MKLFGFEIRRYVKSLNTPEVDIAAIKSEARLNGYRDAEYKAEAEEKRRNEFYQNWRNELIDERQRLVSEKANWENTKNTYVLEKLKEIGR